MQRFYSRLGIVGRTSNLDRNCPFKWKHTCYFGVKDQLQMGAIVRDSTVSFFIFAV